MNTTDESIALICVWNLDAIHCKKWLMWNDYWRLCCCKVPQKQRLETLVVYCSIILSEAANHIINPIWRVHTQRGDASDASTCVSRAAAVLIHHDNAYARWRSYGKKKGWTENDEVIEKNTTHTCCYLISINNAGEGNNTLSPLSSIFFPSDTPDKIILELPVVSEKNNPKTMNKILVKIAFFIWIM